VFFFPCLGQHISLLFGFLIRSEQTGTCAPWDDGGLCLVDTPRAFGEDSSVGFGDFCVLLGDLVFVQASIWIEVGVFVLEAQPGADSSLYHRAL